MADLLDDPLCLVEEPLDWLRQDVVWGDGVVEGGVGQALHAGVVPQPVHVVLVHGDLAIDLVHQATESSWEKSIFHGRGGGTSGWAMALRQAGFESWGFFSSEFF